MLTGKAAERAVGAVEQDLDRLHLVDLTEAVLREAALIARRAPLTALSRAPVQTGVRDSRTHA